jgi:hypothetical protein
MIWKNPNEELPRDKEEVLIRNGKEYHLAIYENDKKVFRLRNKLEVSISSNLVWTRLIAP